MKRKGLVEMRVHRDSLQVRIGMTFRRIWGRMDGREQVETLLLMAAYLHELAGQMEAEATEVAEAEAARRVAKLAPAGGAL